MEIHLQSKSKSESKHAHEDKKLILWLESKADMNIFMQLYFYIFKRSTERIQNLTFLYELVNMYK